MYTLSQDNYKEVAEKVMKGSRYTAHAICAFKFMLEAIHTPVSVEDSYVTTNIEGLTSGLFQKLRGDGDSYYLGFVDLHEGLTAIASGFAEEQFEDTRMFVLDATGEFINRINGDYVIKQTGSGHSFMMEPQLFLEESEAKSRLPFNNVTHVPVSIGDSHAEMLFLSE